MFFKHLTQIQESHNFKLPKCEIAFREQFSQRQLMQYNLFVVLSNATHDKHKTDKHILQ